MEDKLKDFVRAHRSSFDSFDPPDLWNVIHASIGTTLPIVKPKFPIKMIVKYGFGASAIVVASFVTLHQLKDVSPRVSKTDSVRQVLSPPLPSPLIAPLAAESLPVQKIELPARMQDIIPVTGETTSSTKEIVAAVIGVKDSLSAGKARMIDTMFTGIKKLEVNGKFCNVSLKGGSGEGLHLKGQMSESSGNVTVLGNVAYKKSQSMIRYYKQGTTLKVWIEDEELKEKEKVSMNDKEESFLEFEGPAGLELKIANSSGNITAKGFTAGGELKSQFGNIMVEDFSGAMTLKSSSGNITGLKLTGAFNQNRVSVTRHTPI